MVLINVKIRIVFFLMFLFQAGYINGQNIFSPEPYGGMRLMKEFIREEMIYPANDLENNVEGTVLFVFVVNKDGNTSNLMVKESISSGIDREAIRIFKKILWHPGTHFGMPIACRHYLEIKFDIKKYQKYCKARGYSSISYPYTPVDTTNNIYNLQETDVAPIPVYNSECFNFNSFIANNLTYPEVAFKQNISGTVKLTFVVEPRGGISNIEITNLIGGGCTQEAIRVIKLLKWNPGIVNGIAVRSFKSINITFDMAKQSVRGSIPVPGQVR